jgi:competence protein ComEC
MRAPAVLLAIPLIVGCAVGLGCGERAPASLAACAAAASLLALLASVAALGAGSDAAAECTVCLVAGALAIGLSSGADAAVRAYRSPLYAWFESHRPQSLPAVLHGRLREDAAVTDTGVSLTVDVRAIEPCSGSVQPAAAGEGPCPARGGVRLTVVGSLAPGAMGEWRAGRTVRITATLREPTVYRNPGVPDEQRALARRGIALVGSVKSAAMVDVVARGSALTEWEAAFRAWVRAVLTATVAPWSVRSAGVAAAIAIGDRTGLASDDEERLQAAGTYHVIAISGGNIAILTLLLLGAGRWLGASPRASAAVAIVVLLAYGRITGSAPSVDRAISAAVVFLGGRLLEQRGPSINILAVAAIFGVASSATAVFDAGFLLSFSATLGILIGVPMAMPLLATGGRHPMQPRWDTAADVRQRRASRRSSAWPLVAVRRVARAAATLLAATMAAEVALAPIAAALFGRVTCAGLLLNFAAIPLMTIVQAGSLVTLGVSLVDSDLARGCGYVVHLAARGLVDSARLVDLAPWLAREVAPPAWGMLAGYYGSLGLALIRTRCSSAAAALTALLGFFIVMGPHATTRDRVAPPLRGVLRVVFLDVGQGDATLLMLPDGRAFLIDAGGLPAAPLRDPTDGPSFDIGDRVVARALGAFGVRSLDTFVLTHADPDHIGGARTVVGRFRPRAIWEGVPVPPHDPLRWLADAGDRIGAEWRRVRAGDELRVGDVSIRALHPPPPDWERQRVRNDDSLVLAISMGQVSVILPGDIGRDGETRTLEHLEPAPLTVLKAPHHGSATSSTREFLEAATPAAVIVSAGRGNRFGHPAPVIVERYRAMGVTMFSTAEEGAVILDTDGERVWIRTWGGREATFKSSALEKPLTVSKSSR